MLGTSLPSRNSPDPIPVPNVSMMTTPSRPRPTPYRISASPAASASLITCTGRPDAAVKTRRFRADPRLVDVRRGAGHAVAHHRREGDADFVLPFEVVDELAHHLGHRRRVRRLGGEDLVAVRSQRAGGQVDRAAFMPEPPMSMPNAVAWSVLTNRTLRGAVGRLDEGRRVLDSSTRAIASANRRGSARAVSNGHGAVRIGPPTHLSSCSDIRPLDGLVLGCAPSAHPALVLRSLWPASRCLGQAPGGSGRLVRHRRDRARSRFGRGAGRRPGCAAAGHQRNDGVGGDVRNHPSRPWRSSFRPRSSDRQLGYAEQCAIAAARGVVRRTVLTPILVFG